MKMRLSAWPGDFLTSILAFALASGLALILGGCGGGSDAQPAVSPPVAATGTGGTPTVPVNTVVVTIDKGSDGTAFNSPFVNVTVCVPGTTTCEVIDHVLVDTGSYGLRLSASALDSSFTLPPVSAPSGAPLAECAAFASGFAWGSVRLADVIMAGEKATAIPVEVVNDRASPYATVPASCSNSGSNFGVGNGGKGILGVGTQPRDCGSACAVAASAALYFSCPTSGCTSTVVPLESQVANPVAFFDRDNNGIAITLPAVPSSGSSSPTGTLTFGIGTQPDNLIVGATVFATDSQGNFTTTYKGTRLTSFLDSGSNALFFPDPTIAQCPSGFYCPARPLALTATMASATGVTADVPFTIVSPQTLPAETTVAPIGGNATGLGRVFDWGLPFFLGRTVFVAFTGATTAYGPGPFFAF